MKRYKWTLFGACVSVMLYMVTLLFNIDLFEMIVEFLMTFEDYEVDELVVPMAVLAAFAVIDVVKRQKLHAVDMERIKIYKAMLHSTHHVLNNFINQMQLFKMTAEETPGFPEDVLSLYDRCIKDARIQVEALSSITQIDEASIVESVTL